MASSRPSQDERDEVAGAGIRPFPLRRESITWLRLALPLTVLLSACGVTDPLPQVAASENELHTHHLTAPEAEHLERYGAAAAVNDGVAIVGAWGNSRRGHEAGGAYVYRYEETADEWTLDGGLLSPDDLAPGSRFGHAVAIEEDVVAISAIYDGSRGYRAGAVYLFERDAEGWQEREKLLPPPDSDNAHFGSAISLTRNTLAVSSAGASTPRVDTFTRSAEGWREDGSVIAPSAADGQYFGGDLALRDDTLVVGASHRENSAPGSVYLYRRGEEGWNHSGTLQGDDAEPLFGSAVDLGTAGLLAVGAPNPAKGGAVYLYRLTRDVGSSVAAQQEQVLRPEVGGHPHFGSALAVSEETVAVGSPGAPHQGFSSGLVQVHRNDGANGWIMAFEITPSIPADDLAFGITVAGDDRNLAIGATGEIDGGTIAGSVEMVLLQPEPAYTK